MNDHPHGSRRQRLWELPDHFHCSVIGTCLTLDELKKILRRCHIRLEGNFSDYDLHGAFVTMAGTACSATRQAQKVLDRKHAVDIRQFGKRRGEAALARLWDEKFGAGQVAGGYWALITHPDASDALLTRAHGEVHMLSHQIGATNRVDLKRLALLEQCCTDLEAELSATRARSARQLHERDTALQKINTRLIEAMDAERQLQFATHRIHQLEGGKELQHLRQRVRELTRNQEAAVRAGNQAFLFTTCQTTDTYATCQFVGVHSESQGGGSVMRFEFRSCDDLSTTSRIAGTPVTSNSPESSKDSDIQPVRVAIDSKKLQRLFETGAICAADLRCLDCASKRCVWKLCLQACARCMIMRSGQQHGDR